MSDSPSPRLVTLERSWQAVIIRPPVEALTHLTSWLQGPEFAPRRGYVFKRYPVPLVVPDCWGSALKCWAGLEPVVMEYLRRLGYEPQLTNPVASLVEPAWERLTGYAPLDRHVLDCVRDHDRAILRCGIGVINPGHVVAQIADAWPNKRVAVLVSDSRSGNSITDVVRQYGIPAFFFHRGRGSIGGMRVAVTTFSDNGFLDADCDSWDIVVCLDATRAIGRHGLDRLPHARRARLYGLLPIGITVSSCDQDDLHRLFGFHRVSLPKHGHRELPVDVAVARISGGRASTSQDIVRVKRDLIWRNPVRNRRLVRLAAGLADGNLTNVAALCPRAADWLAVHSAPHHVVMLVDSADHHDQMQREVARQRRGKPRRTGFGAEPHVAVVTFDQLPSIDWERISAIVRADCGVGLPPFLDPQSLAVSCESLRRLLLVDVDDRAHPELRVRAKARTDAYLLRGWLPLGADAISTHVATFLAAKGRVRA
jgi:hypothetical protein